MIVACLSWYDEPLDGLDRCVSSLAGVADLLLAVDGAFESFPHRRPWSEHDQHGVIMDAAVEAGLLLELVAVVDPWQGDEVGKRAWMTQRGVELAGGGWLLVIDGDEYVEESVPSLSRRLEQSIAIGDGAAYVQFRVNEMRHPLPRLFRAQAGLTVRGAHWRYVLGDRVICAHGNEPEEPIADAAELIALRHAPTRTDERQQRRGEFAVIRKTIEA